MRRVPVRLLVACLAWGSTLLAAQDQPSNPIESGAEERVQVNLVLVDTLVLDRQGRTVPGLTRDDFLLTVQGRPVPIDVVDANCPGGALEDPRNAGPDGRREALAPPADRRMVLVIDYYHLDHIFRGQSLRAAQAIVRDVKAPGDEVMIAALADGLRIEQRFTRDVDALVGTLERMEYDRSLWARDFGSVTDRGFFDNLATLMDVLAEYDGPKATVLFSMMLRYRDQWDLWFGEVVQRAAVGRVALYPVWAGGLEIGAPGGGSAPLARLANESGGRLTHRTSDLSLAYARAQRDLSCRYTIGFHVDPSKKRYPQRVHVGVKHRGLEVRQPEEIRFWTEQERRASRIRAAFADPLRHDDPLVRAAVFPIRPRSDRIWEALLVAHFPQHLGEHGATREIAVDLSREKLRLWSLQETLKLDPPQDGETGSRPVTVYGESPVEPGAHTMTVVLSTSGGENLKTTRVEVEVPQIPLNRLFFRGPVLARVAGRGVLIHPRDKKAAEEQSALEALIGEDNTVEPLLVNRFAPEDHVLAIWEACLVAGELPGKGSRILRRVVGDDGSLAHRLPPLALDLQGRGKVFCQGGLDDLEPGTLTPGRYRLEVSVETKRGHEVLAAEALPFVVR